MLTVISYGFNHTFYEFIRILFVFLYDILMMAVEASETRRQIVLCDKIYFIDVRLLVCYRT